MMFTNREREVIRRSLLDWPSHRAHLFMRNLSYKGRLIDNELAALHILHINPGAIQFGSPEVVLAGHRQDLTFEGIERAFRDLTAYCRSQSQSYIYLELLDNNPEFLTTLFESRKEVGFGP